MNGFTLQFPSTEILPLHNFQKWDCQCQWAYFFGIWDVWGMQHLPTGYPTSQLTKAPHKLCLWRLFISWPASVVYPQPLLQLSSLLIEALRPAHLQETGSGGHQAQQQGHDCQPAGPPQRQHKEVQGVRGAGHGTPDMWHMTCVTWHTGVLNIVPKF